MICTDKNQGAMSANWNQLPMITVSGPGVSPSAHYADDHLHGFGIVKEAITTCLDSALSSRSQPTRRCA
eukprot:6267311-Pyramimonas_sp.AAC.1